MKTIILVSTALVMFIGIIWWGITKIYLCTTEAVLLGYCA
jgi:hypothetical protein